MRGRTPVENAKWRYFLARKWNQDPGTAVRILSYHRGLTKSLLRACRVLLRAHVKNIGARPTNSQKIDIAKRRERLLGRILEFQSQAEIFLEALNLDVSLPEEVDEDWSDGELEQTAADLLSDWTNENTKLLSRGQVENITLFLPSTVGKDACVEANIQSIARKERKLRVGQANDSLHQLRLVIGQKSFMFRNQLRNAKSKTRKTRAWDDINAISNTVSHHRRVYHSARNALMSLGASKDILAKYQVVTAADTRSSTVIVDPNPRGQRNTGLPWFWGQQMSGARPAAEEGSPIMTECTYRAFIGTSAQVRIVYRVHWLRARARHERWKEEWDVTSHEMGWTVNFLAHKASMWKRWAHKAHRDGRPGHECYAKRQEAFWLSMKDNAIQSFQRAILTVNKGDTDGRIPGLDPIHQSSFMQAHPAGGSGSDSVGSMNQADEFVDVGEQLSRGGIVPESSPTGSDESAVDQEDQEAALRISAGSEGQTSASSESAADNEEDGEDALQAAAGSEVHSSASSESGPEQETIHRSGRRVGASTESILTDSDESGYETSLESD